MNLNVSRSFILTIGFDLCQHDTYTHTCTHKVMVFVFWHFFAICWAVDIRVELSLHGTKGRERSRFHRVICRFRNIQKTQMAFVINGMDSKQIGQRESILFQTNGVLSKNFPI